MLGLELGLIGLILTYDLQSHERYGRDPHTCKKSRSKDSQFKRQNGNGQINGRMEATALPPVPTRLIIEQRKITLT